MQGQCIHDLYIYLYSCCKSVSDKCEQPIHTFTLNSCQTFHCNCYEIQLKSDNITSSLEAVSEKQRAMTSQPDSQQSAT